ncbi:GIY-YIG nuclease family protein [Photobacterium satsumensis]|uniref:GIY-YIG nuclease family protein n=1 Tax=Photobacterium satsumensis TaxID=2910239 RepID=UPI003D0B7C10
MHDEFLSNYQYRDYTVDAVMDETLRNIDSRENWIYIGVDTEKRGRAKIGMTTNGLETRGRCASNPDYLICYAFKLKANVKKEKVKEIEGYIKSNVENRGFKAIKHRSTNNKSEWFFISPQELREIIRQILIDIFMFDVDGHYDFDREEYILNIFENRTGEPLSCVDYTPKFHK